MNQQEKSLEKIRSLSRLYNIDEFTRQVYGIQEFQMWPASIDKHHAYRGGLLDHTAEVMELCNTLASQQRLPWDKCRELLIAACFHDYGKIFDYEESSEEPKVFSKSSHYYKIHHIHSSAARFSKCWDDSAFVHYGSFLECTDYDEFMQGINPDEVTHCILSHHQLREWGSPVAPQSKSAWILHCADMISARCNQV